MGTNEDLRVVKEDEDCCECELDMDVTYYWVSAIVAIIAVVLFVLWVVSA